MEDKIGNETQQTANPEDFFGAENQPEETTEETSIVTDEQTEVSEFNGDEWKFKAAGKEFVPKTKDELIKYASLGINYDTKARKLNEERAKFLEEKKAFDEQRGQVPQKTEEEDGLGIDLNNPFLDPAVATLAKTIQTLQTQLKEIGQKAENANSITSSMSQQQYDEWLDFGLNNLKDEIGESYSDELESELCLDLQEMMDTIPDDRVTSKEGVANLIRSIFYLKHPEGLDSVVKTRVQKGLDKTKQINGSKVITEGQAKGAAQRNPNPGSWEEADDMALNMFRGK